MNIRDYIDSRSSFCIGLFGPAGSGKTTLMNILRSERSELVTFSLDNYFIGDSLFRKSRTQKALISSGIIGSHILMIDWWDWDRLFIDLDNAVSSKSSKVILEGALVPAIHYWAYFDSLFMLYHPEDDRVSDLFNRDSGKRSKKELIQRLLITNYAESASYEPMFKSSSIFLHNKLVVLINRQGDRLNDYKTLDHFLDSCKNKTSISLADLKECLESI